MGLYGVHLLLVARFEFAVGSTTLAKQEKRFFN